MILVKWMLCRFRALAVQDYGVVDTAIDTRPSSYDLKGIVQQSDRNELVEKL